MSQAVYKVCFAVLGVNLFVWGIYALNVLPKKGSWCRKLTTLSVAAAGGFWFTDALAGNHYRIDGLLMVFSVAVHLWCLAWEEFAFGVVKLRSP